MRFRGFIKFFCRRSVGFFIRAFLVLLRKESKKRTRKQPGYWWLLISFTASQFAQCLALNESPGEWQMHFWQLTNQKPWLLPWHLLVSSHWTDVTTALWLQGRILCKYLILAFLVLFGSMSDSLCLTMGILAQLYLSKIIMNHDLTELSWFAAKAYQKVWLGLSPVHLGTYIAWPLSCVIQLDKKACSAIHAVNLRNFLGAETRTVVSNSSNYLFMNLPRTIVLVCMRCVTVKLKPGFWMIGND